MGSRRVLLRLLLGVLCLAPTTESAAARQFPGDVNDPFTAYSRALLLLVDSAEQVSSLVLPMDVHDFEERGPWWEQLRLVGRFGRSQGLRPSWWGVQARGLFSSGYPVDQLDGAIWRGKGISAGVELGAGWRFGLLHVTLAPSMFWAQNRSLELWPVTLPGQPAEAYPWRWIDWPQRQSGTAFVALDLGQSELAIRGDRLTAGVSTRNRRWGPGVQNSIVLGSGAGGFPHGFLATSRPLESRLGRFEGQLLHGRLSRSGSFLPDQPDPGRFITGVTAVWSPRWVTGLHVGANLVRYGYVTQEGSLLGLSANDLFGVGGDESDHLGSIFFKWALTPSGFEVYAEWARNDRWSGINDLLLQPEHSQGYTLGLQKAFDRGQERLLSFSAELTHLESEATSRLRDNPTFYAHSVVLEGYTHKGQLLGAVVGPGGIQQHLGLTWYHPAGSEAIWLRRRVRDNDAYYYWAERTTSDRCVYCSHDVTFELGGEVLRLLGEREISVGIDVARQRNRWIEGPDVWNVGAALRIRRLGGALVGSGG